MHVPLGTQDYPNNAKKGSLACVCVSDLGIEDGRYGVILLCVVRETLGSWPAPFTSYDRELLEHWGKKANEAFDRLREEARKSNEERRLRVMELFLAQCQTESEKVLVASMREILSGLLSCRLMGLYLSDKKGRLVDCTREDGGRSRVRVKG